MWSETLGSGKPVKDTLFSEEQRDTCCTAKSRHHSFKIRKRELYSPI